MDEPRATKEELIAKAEKPAKDSLKMHPFYKGKIEIVPKCVIRSVDDFAIWYTPGVAAVCKDIERDPEASFIHTNRANMVGIVTDGTRVLGLGTSVLWQQCPSWRAKPSFSSIWVALTPFPSVLIRRIRMNSSAP
jgi:malic enzyme